VSDTDTPPAALALDPTTLLKDRKYLVLLFFGALIGVPAAAMAYFFLKIVAECQHFVFTTLPENLGFSTPPVWWPVPLLALSGLLVALSIQYLPGTSGHKPAAGFVAGGPVMPAELPGIVLAAFATLVGGVVLGPEAPLIAMGSGLGVLVVHLVKKDAPQQAILVIGVAGSFAAVSTLLGSPIVGAFLMMEAAGLGALTGVILAPGLIASGIGAMIFIGLDNWTGFGTFSLAIPGIPPFTSPTVAELLWALVIGVLAAVLGSSIRHLGVFLQPIVERRKVWLTPVAGVVIALAAIVFAQVTGHGIDQVLFSGQDALGPLITDAAGWTVGALLLLIVCKGLAYGVSLSCFRGGPTFPGMFIGAAMGMALSHLPGLSMIAGVAMGIGAMTVVMLGGMPLTSVVLTVVFLSADGLALTPLIIIAVVVAYVASAYLAPKPADEPAAAAAAPTG
jgi:H+/Cl- antiporter ClcA